MASDPTLAGIKPLTAKQIKAEIGIRCGKLTVIARYPGSPKDPGPMRPKVRVQCDCGSPPFTIPRQYLTRRKPLTHCGCANKGLPTLHVLAYRSWQAMRQRCSYPGHVAWAEYGGRGIKVCSQWDDPITGFEQFLKDMGDRPSKKHSIDRWPDNDGNYEPGNCRWATAKEQRHNQRPRRDLRGAKP